VQSLYTIVETAIPLVGLISIRVAVTLASMPAPFGLGAPMRIRAVFGLWVAYIISIPHIGVLDTPPLTPLVFGRAALFEFLVGAVMGLTVRVTLAAVGVAGSFAGMSMGLGFARSADPNSGEQGLATAALLRAFATAIFFVLQGHHTVLQALSASVVAVPPGHIIPALVNGGVMDIGVNMVAHGLRIAAPIMATMFVVQVGIGVMSRSAPRVHIFAFSFAIAAGAGMLMMYVSAPSLAQSVMIELQYLSDALYSVLAK
jgi:flagellar biosynthetic protein FliR